MRMTKRQARLRRKMRIRKKIFGTPERPRLVVYRSNLHLYVQAVDDTTGATVASASSLAMGKEKPVKLTRETAAEVGKEIARRMKDKNIETVVFDRNGYIYHGRIKALADGAREEGLKF